MLTRLELIPASAGGCHLTARISSSNQGWERWESVSPAAPRPAHAANPADSRSFRIDSRKPAIWFQLGTLRDATHHKSNYIN